MVHLNPEGFSNAVRDLVPFPTGVLAVLRLCFEPVAYRDGSAQEM